MRTLWAAAVIAAIGAATGPGCSESPYVPEVDGGAGIRVILPEGSEALDGIRVELWDDNPVLPLHCEGAGAGPGRGAPRGVFLPVEEPDPDNCTRMEVFIWDYTGFDYRAEPVLYIPDTVAVKGSLSFPWDGRDGDGNEVSSGVYPTFSRCLDSRGEFTFRGHYVYWADRESGACRWPLWIREIGSSAGRVREFGPFPEESGTVLRDDSGEQISTVHFENPFLVRVVAPGMEVFEAEITLEAGRFAVVEVAFVPAE